MNSTKSNLHPDKNIRIQDLCTHVVYSVCGFFASLHELIIQLGSLCLYLIIILSFLWQNRDWTWLHMIYFGIKRDLK